MNRLFFPIVAVLSISIIAPACSILRDVAQRGSNPDTTQKPLNYAQIPDIPVPNEPPLAWKGDGEFDNFTAKVRSQITNRDFRGLDKTALDLRNSKAKFEKGGGWKIRSFYDITEEPEHRTEKDWVDHIQVLRDWKDATQSMAARSSLAMAYIAYAWIARGETSAKEVPSTAWAAVESRIKLAATEVAEAAELDERCYGYYQVLLRLGRVAGMPRARYDKAFDEATNFDRSYPYFYIQKAEYLLPRWHGKPGEVTDFAEMVWASLGESEGPKFYYLIAATLHGYGGAKSELFQPNGLSWKKTKMGFVQFEKDHGMSRFRLNQFASMSSTANDAQAQCSTFKRLSGEDDFDAEGIWRDRKAFEQTRAIALNTMCTIPRLSNQAN